MAYVKAITREGWIMFTSILPHLSACMAFHLAMEGELLGIAIILLTFALVRQK